MTKPWEETWTAYQHSVLATVPSEANGWLGAIIVNTDGGYYGRGGTDLALIAAAPDLYRALVACEWAGDDGHCVACGQHEAPHDPGCKIDAALRKARGEQP